MTTLARHTREEMAALLGPPTRKTLQRRVVRWLLGAGVLVVLFVAAEVLMRSKAGAAGPAYLTERVRRGDLNVQVSATGKLQPTNTVDVGSELSGLVESVYVDENQAVRKGQVLARLDTSKLQDEITKSEAALASANAKLAQTAATVKEASANLDRLREVSRLSGGKVPSQAEMATAEATLARAQGDQGAADAAVTEARAALSSDRTNLAKASIRSPIDGIVLTRSVEPGQTVAASLQAPTLFKIAQDLRQMELKVDVDEADVGRVKQGQHATFTVDAYPNRNYSAQVERVAYGSTTSADVVSYSTELNVTNDDLTLRPGMTASAQIATASVTGAVLVPNAALRFTPPSAAAPQNSRGLMGSLLPGPRRGRGGPQPTAATRASGRQQVWVLRDGTPVPVRVGAGQTDGRFTEITSGDLREGMQVITDVSGAQS